jgi:hypothetical protein
MNHKDTVKPAGHYKPNFSLVEPKVKVGVKYDQEEVKEQIIESIGSK